MACWSASTSVCALTTASGTDAPEVVRRLDSAWSMAPWPSAACGGEVAVLEHGQKLALLHVVAAVDVELLDRRGDLGHDAGLVAREEHAVAGDDAADGVLGHGRDLDRRGRFGFAFLLLGAARHGYQAGGQS